VKLTGDFDNAIEVIRIGNCFPFRIFAKNSRICNFRLLQHNRRYSDRADLLENCTFIISQADALMDGSTLRLIRHRLNGYLDLA
jgi:hypothetical protein